MVEPLSFFIGMGAGILCFIMSAAGKK